MKRTVWLLVSLLLISSAAMADHIGIYSDTTGQSCNLGNIVGQFSSTVTVIHKYSQGAIGSRFNITFPPGTSFFSFNSPYFPVCDPGPCDGISLGYGQCRTGNIVLGTLLAIYGAGTLHVVPAQSFSEILYTDCAFVEKAATGGAAYVGTPGDCEEPVATEPSTWGSVKALYR
jgi:hypothetical protein